MSLAKGIRRLDEKKHTHCHQENSPNRLGGVLLVKGHNGDTCGARKQEQIYWTVTHPTIGRQQCQSRRHRCPEITFQQPPVTEPIPTIIFRFFTAKPLGAVTKSEVPPKTLTRCEKKSPWEPGRSPWPRSQGDGRKGGGFFILGHLIGTVTNKLKWERQGCFRITGGHKRLDLHQMHCEFIRKIHNERSQIPFFHQALCLSFPALRFSPDSLPIYSSPLPTPKY